MKLDEIITTLWERCPQWRQLTRVLEYADAPGIETVDNDGRTIYYDSQMMKRFTDEVQCFFFAQQIMHIQLAHFDRGRDYDPVIWKEATDAIVNEMIIEDGFEPPVGLIRRADAKYMNAEDLYLRMMHEEEDRDPEDKNEDELVIIAKPEEEKLPDKTPGKEKGDKRRDIDEPDLIKAVTGLADFIEPSRQIDYDWFPGDTIRDGMLKEKFKPYPVPHAEVLLDTSASIDEDLLRAFVSGVKGILQDDAVLKVGCFDTEFYGFQEVRSDKDIREMEIKGSGGTNFETAIKAFTGDAETKIIFTDGYAEMPLQRCDAIWLVYSDIPIHPPGGQVIYVKKPEELETYEIDFLIT